MDYSFPVEGAYSVAVEVTDDKGLTTKSSSVNINAGNDVPRLNFALAGNSQFYFPELSNAYSLNVEDSEDGSLATKGIDLQQLMVKTNYIDSPDKAALPVGHQTTVVMGGKRVMEGGDCQSCHKINDKSVAPSFTAVSGRYPKSAANSDYLIKKIINGGGGVWGETAMSAHPALTKGDAGAIVDWIYTLTNDKIEKSLPSRGSIAAPKELKDNGLLILSASYTDKGQKAQTGETSIELHHPLLQAVDADKLSHCRKIDFDQQELIAFDEKEGFLTYKNLDLTSVKAFELHYGIPAALDNDYTLEVRLDSPQGTLIASQLFGKKAAPTKPELQRIAIQQVTDKKRHDVYFIFKRNDDKNVGLYVGKFGLKAK